MSNSESSQKLKIGDVVELKSGGPTMTVSNIDKNGQIYCQWFAGEYDKDREGYFPFGSLKLVVE